MQWRQTYLVAGLLVGLAFLFNPDFVFACDDGCDSWIGLSNAGGVGAYNWGTDIYSIVDYSVSVSYDSSPVGGCASFYGSCGGGDFGLYGNYSSGPLGMGGGFDGSGSYGLEGIPGLSPYGGGFGGLPTYGTYGFGQTVFVSAGGPTLLPQGSGVPFGYTPMSPIASSPLPPYFSPPFSFPYTTNPGSFNPYLPIYYPNYNPPPGSSPYLPPSLPSLPPVTSGPIASYPPSYPSLPPTVPWSPISPVTNNPIPAPPTGNIPLGGCDGVVVVCPSGPITRPPIGQYPPTITNNPIGQTPSSPISPTSTPVYTYTGNPGTNWRVNRNNEVSH